MPNTKDIRRRIKSIKSTGKITKAMEMVSAVKMRKAVERMLASRDYAGLAWQIVQNLATRTDSSLHRLLENKKIKKVAVVVISSNRGLCGSFNSQIISQAIKYTETDDKREMSFILLGKKGREIVTKYNKSALAEFDKLDVTTKAEEIFGLSQMIINDYMAKKFDQVVLAYTDYTSSLKQTPRIKILLPIPREADAQLGQTNEKQIEKKPEVNDEREYLFEPNAKYVLETMLPRLLETQIYQAVLESDASEHSSRMMAMKNATESAHDLITDLTLAYNQIRQAGITREIAEISGAKAAMGN